MDTQTENAVHLMRLLIKSFTPLQRVDFWNQISCGYCKDCGTPLNICHAEGFKFIACNCKNK